jgi:hypothetical protein
VYSRVAGDEDTNDADRLAGDPAMRVVTGRRDLEKQAASTNTLSRFETEVLTQEENVEGLAQLNATWVEKAMAHTPHRRVILDMDSSEARSTESKKEPPIAAILSVCVIILCSASTSSGTARG